MSDRLPKPLHSYKSISSGFELIPPPKFSYSGFSKFKSDTEYAYAIKAFYIAWAQKPPGSLPEDPRELAMLFNKRPDRILSFYPIIFDGWILCSDGRFYNQYLADRISESYAAKLADRNRMRRHRTVQKNSVQNGAKHQKTAESCQSGVRVASEWRQSDTTVTPQWQTEDNKINDLEDLSRERHGTEVEVEVENITCPEDNVLANTDKEVSSGSACSSSDATRPTKKRSYIKVGFDWKPDDQSLDWMRFFVGDRELSSTEIDGVVRHYVTYWSNTKKRRTPENWQREFRNNWSVQKDLKEGKYRSSTKKNGKRSIFAGVITGGMK